MLVFYYLNLKDIFHNMTQVNYSYDEYYDYDYIYITLSNCPLTCILDNATKCALQVRYHNTTVILDYFLKNQHSVPTITIPHFTSDTLSGINGHS